CSCRSKEPTRTLWPRQELLKKSSRRKACGLDLVTRMQPNCGQSRGLVQFEQDRAACSLSRFHRRKAKGRRRLRMIWAHDVLESSACKHLLPLAAENTHRQKSF